jgi:aminopeptidase-like protein
MLTDVAPERNLIDAGREAYDVISRLYPICRSITGDGVRQTLRMLQGVIPVAVHEVPTGTRAFDWTVPKEWNIRGAYIKDAHGKTIVDFDNCNLHVVGYSVPIRQRVSLDELKEHTFTLPLHPNWIPYRTSYYKETWGFCLSDAQLCALCDGYYEVCIDSTLEDGHLTYGEYFIPGSTDDEILISVHVCHPSLANDNLSGVAVAALLARELQQHSPWRYSYRFLFIPGTIGSITWLALNESRVNRIKHGVILACVGDKGPVTYKKSRKGNAEVDRAILTVLKDAGEPYSIVEFSPYGYDERQFCSPGFDLSVGCLMRTPHGQFPEYHTSADNLELVDPYSLAHTFRTCMRLFDILEKNDVYINLNPKCEPQLGRRGLYNTIGGATNGKAFELAMLWVLNQSDGTTSLLDIAERSDLPFSSISRAADALVTHGLLRRVNASAI